MQLTETPEISIDLFVAKLSVAIAQQIKSPIPLSIDLWNIEMIGKFLKRDAKVVRERIVNLPDFPKAIRLPSEKGRGGHPLYNAQEIVLWANTYKDKEDQKKRWR